VKTGKAGDATQQKHIRREHSTALILPRSQSSAAVFAPTGKPKISPEMSADAPRLMPNILKNKRSRQRSTTSAPPNDTKSDDKTQNGNTAGMTLVAQSDSDERTDEVTTSGIKRKAAEHKTHAER
jgi:hypothetical protein